MSAPEPPSAQFSEPDYARSTLKKTDYPWYLTSIDKHLLPETQQLLENYSKVPLAEQSKHVHDIRDKAWAIRSYPCTGLGVFLVPFISRSAAYPTILKRLSAGDTFLDVGCFLGGDMRRLAFDGAPTANLYGVDIVSHWDVGYELYRDRGRFNAHFIETDILSSGNPALEELKGHIDILSVSAVLHQWNWDDQVKAASKFVAFTKPGAILLGYQIGNIEAKEVTNPALKVPQWRHDPASFAKMWAQVGAATGTTWETEARLHTWEDMGWDPADSAWMEPGDKVIAFVVTRKQ